MWQFPHLWKPDCLFLFDLPKRDGLSQLCMAKKPCSFSVWWISWLWSSRWSQDYGSKAGFILHICHRFTCLSEGNSISTFAFQKSFYSHIHSCLHPFIHLFILIFWFFPPPLIWAFCSFLLFRSLFKIKTYRRYWAQISFT